MEYIVVFKPYVNDNVDYELLSDIEDRILNKISVTNEEVKYFLDSLCYIARNKINSNMDNFDYKCDMFQVMFYHYFSNLDCEFIPCMTQNAITNDIIGHSFSILKLLVDGEEKLYLIDPSYIQFFSANKCKENNYFFDPNHRNYLLMTPDPGYFINENDKNIINLLLENGYIELCENVARIYGDSFLNTKRGFRDKNVFQTIPGNVYIKSFLKGTEIIRINEETLKDLGFYIDLFCEYSIKNKNSKL